MCENFLLIDAYNFIRQASSFPDQPTDITYIEFLFLLEGYRLVYEKNRDSVYGSQFEAGIQELNKPGEMNVRR